MFKRKHHCRSCGQIFCDGCSSHLISGNRVCDRCVTQLASGQPVSGPRRNSTAFAQNTRPRDVITRLGEMLSGHPAARGELSIEPEPSNQNPVDVGSVASLHRHAAQHRMARRMSGYAGSTPSAAETVSTGERAAERAEQQAWSHRQHGQQQAQMTAQLAAPLMQVQAQPRAPPPTSQVQQLDAGTLLQAQHHHERVHAWLGPQLQVQGRGPATRALNAALIPAQAQLPALPLAHGNVHWMVAPGRTDSAEAARVALADHFPTHVISEDELAVAAELQRSWAAKVCVICMEGFHAGETRKTLPCFHYFHQQCVDPWLRQKAECPTCKLRLEMPEEAGAGASGDGIQ